MFKSKAPPKAAQVAPKVEGSSAFEIVFALSSIVLNIGLLCLIPSLVLALAVGGVWLFTIVVVHLKIYLGGGWRGFVHLIRRYPHSWLISLGGMHVALACKLLAFALHAMNPFSDNVGLLYQVEGEEKLDMRRYTRYAMDLDKPLLHTRTGKDALTFHVYPFMFSPTCMGHLYVCGPYAMLSVLPALTAPSHITVRNDVLALEPAYVLHVTVFFKDSTGRGYLNVCNHTIPPWPRVYRPAFLHLAEQLGERIKESESRTASFATQTFDGKLRHGQFDLPPFELMWDRPKNGGHLVPRKTPPLAFDRVAADAPLL